MSADFRIVKQGRYTAECGHVVTYRVCQELVEGRWEGFVSGGAAAGNICHKCYDASVRAPHVN